MRLQFNLAGAQIDGARDYQEDAFLITHMTDANGDPGALIIVADGMGGHAAGNVASNMAVQGFNTHVSANYPTDNPAKILRECVIKANDAIKKTTAETPALSGMGCTMVAAILEGRKLWWASVGDSHLYLLRNKELSKKNADHSYGGFLARMEAAGTPVTPDPGLARNMLMSAIMGDKIDEIDVPERPLLLQAGDRILLCSDGMDTLGSGKIIQYSEWSDSPKEYAEALLDAVKEVGMPKQDNTTAVVVDVTEKQEAVTETTAADISLKLQERTQINIPARSPVQAPRKKSRAGLFMSITAALLLGIGVAVFMMMDGKLPIPVSSDLSTEDVATDEVFVDDEEPEVAEAISETTTETSTQTTTETAPVDSAQTTPKPAVVTTRTDGVFNDKLKDGGKGPDMIWIPAGEFAMGSSGASRYAEERPRHNVKVTQFAISVKEITFAEYDKYARARGVDRPDSLSLDRDTHPVFFVRWDDAYHYAQWLSEETGVSYRLPSEAEWEYAAGTGKRSPHWWGFKMEPNRAHCQLGCASRFNTQKPTAVGSFAPNKFGVYDTAGNVAEWVEDCWHPNYNGAPADGRVWAGGDCVFRIARGGSFLSPEDSIRHAKRDRLKSDQTYDHIGIRVVREVGQALKTLP